MTEIIEIVKHLPEIWKSVITIVFFILLFLVYSKVSKALTRKKQSVSKSSAGSTKNSRNTEKSDIKLINTDDETAAVIMAIISEKTGVPLNNLDFKSIKCLSEEPVLSGVSDEEAAVIMAVTSHKTKTPLQKLSFKSIKLVTN
ncbi:MAG: OadG family protein [Clostridiales bacterium]|jgi:Na+-transporting methylmalonyl-CoA/oxaloacetate decarboxylase gamma subunit|nr:OadG family protein [Clostridiales bacterium]